MDQAASAWDPPVVVLTGMSDPSAWVLRVRACLPCRPPLALPRLGRCRDGVLVVHWHEHEDSGGVLAVWLRVSQTRVVLSIWPSRWRTAPTHADSHMRAQLVRLAERLCGPVESRTESLHSMVLPYHENQAYVKAEARAAAVI
jgi:hypothetical protein